MALRLGFHFVGRRQPRGSTVQNPVRVQGVYFMTAGFTIFDSGERMRMDGPFAPYVRGSFDRFAIGVLNYRLWWVAVLSPPCVSSFFAPSFGGFIPKGSRRLSDEQLKSFSLCIQYVETCSSSQTPPPTRAQASEASLRETCKKNKKMVEKNTSPGSIPVR